MSVKDRIIIAAMSQAYANARRLGFSAKQAAEEAFMVASFIKEISQPIYR